MLKRLLAIIAIYVLATIAWFVLGGTVGIRSEQRLGALGEDVSELWGGPQTQLAPQVTLEWEVLDLQQEQQKDEKTGRITLVERKVPRLERRPLILSHSDIAVALDLAHRQRGLLWYTTYGVRFAGNYSYQHDDPQAGTLVIEHRFPLQNASYDNFSFTVPGQPDAEILADQQTRVARHRIPIRQGQKIDFAIGYESRGLSTWRYEFGTGVNRVRDFDLRMTTNFAAIDFPAATISPSIREPIDGGWRLQWKFQNLISGYALGMQLPDRLNPGPLAAQISFFAPVCLGFFFVWIFVITLLRGIDLHPMNYLFLAAAFFAFHLLFAYSVAHISILTAFTICSLVSITLVVTYLRLVTGTRFALLEAGLSQLVYLVLFSYAHFYEGITGLIVTIGSILTLFFLMQLTGRLRWADVFRRNAETPAAEAVARP